MDYMKEIQDLQEKIQKCQTDKAKLEGELGTLEKKREEILEELGEEEITEEELQEKINDLEIELEEEIRDCKKQIGDFYDSE